MKVYIIVEVDWDYYKIRGVYVDIKKALEKIEKEKRKGNKKLSIETRQLVE